MLYAKLILGDSTHGARLLAGHGDVYNGVVGAVVVAHTTADAELCVDTALTCLGVEIYGIAGAAHRARTRNATTTEVGNSVVCMYARRASLVNHAHNIILWLLSLHSTVEILRQGSKLVRLVFHIKSQQRQSLVLPYGALLVYAATTNRFRVTRTKLNGQAVDVLAQLAFAPKFDKFCQQTLSDNHYVISNCHRIVVLKCEYNSFATKMEEYRPKS